MPRNSTNRLNALMGPTAARSRPTQSFPELPGEVQDLLRERVRLEQQIAVLTGGSASGSSRPDPRFPVTPLGARRHQDAEWARRRDEAAGQVTQVLDRVTGAARQVQRFIDEPPERTGQRAILGPVERWRDTTAALSAVVADRLPSDPGTGRPPSGDELRRPPSGRGPGGLPSGGDLRLAELPNDPSLRAFGRQLSEPALRDLISLDDRLQRARDRLDILKGGSGDLDRLREVAVLRRADQRRQREVDDRRDGDRLDRARRSDEDRDAARLDQRGRRGGQRTERGDTS